MQRFFLIFLIFLTGSFFASAQNAAEPTELHLVKKGETLYHLSQIYNTTVSHLLDLNPTIVDNRLKTGASVKVPNVKGDVAIKKVKVGPPHYLAPIIYKVNKGETLYSISKKNNTDVETVRMWSDLRSDDIKAGQKIIVGYTGSETQPTTGTTKQKNKSTVTANTTPVAKTQSPDLTPPTVAHVAKTQTQTATAPTATPVSKTQTQAVTATTTAPSKITPAAKTTTSIATKPAVTNTGTASALSNSPTAVPSKYEVNTKAEGGKLVYKTEKGIVTWSKGDNDDGQFYALHPTAPVGTIITVKNLMNSSSVQVKVIGKLPNTAENQNVMIKLSGSAARQLNVLDDKFLATINYMGYKEESVTLK